MKIRTGFVSNSSSSSFIVGYGMLKDGETEESLNERLKEYNAHCYVMDAEGILEYAEYWFPVVSAKHIPDGDWAFVSWYGNEGDEYFYDDDILDYSIAYDLDFFHEAQRNLIQEARKGTYFNTLLPFDCIFGAEHS